MTETKTLFAEWMERCRMTKAQAAQQLGITESLVSCLRSGTLRWRKRPVPALPNILTRYAMVAIELDLELIEGTDADPMHRVEALAMSAILAGFDPHPVEALDGPEPSADDVGQEELNAVPEAPEAREWQKEGASVAASPSHPEPRPPESDLW